ncbi:hypothetical protein A3G53_03290 [Candidatus Nomurabacteria bacterium RIFCSPLOWO2_12_FULL_44_11]|uniref:Uncharacterized protein n=1 Tax=Candidatus Nomurabacteria bacterium RIFCSPLOWO2_12_FULL_44_11 TaxID=1801796 RepID=A0A1F6Y4G9_9BACT|nr:MAG: hypothetical protein A3G53_03290 [Candidatus Nomurabacteria bacterium RIFCSPLOWO2_12_FULL_44_11]
MKPRHSAEQSTTVVNKAEALGKRGFAVLRDKIQVPPIVIDTTNMKPIGISNIVSAMAYATPVEQQPIETIEIKEPVSIIKNTMKVHLPEDPQDALLCEGCQ